MHELIAFASLPTSLSVTQARALGTPQHRKGTPTFMCRILTSDDSPAPRVLHYLISISQQLHVYCAEVFLLN